LKIMIRNGYSVPTVYGLLLLIGVTSGVGDILLYQWAKSRGTVWLLMAYTVWIFSLTLYGFLFRTEHFSFGAAVVLATVIHLVISVLWGLFFTESKLSTIEMAGLILAIIAVILLEVGRSKSG